MFRHLNKIHLQFVWANSEKIYEQKFKQTNQINYETIPVTSSAIFSLKCVWSYIYLRQSLFYLISLE